MPHGKGAAEDRAKMPALEAFFDRFIEVWYYIGVVLIGVAFLSVVIEVLFRYFLNTSLEWSLDVTEYSLVSMSAFGFAWVLRNEQHVILDSIINMMRPRHIALANAITSIIGVIICLIVVVAGAFNWWDHLVRGTYIGEKALHPTTALLTWVMPYGFLLLAIQFVRRSIGYFKAWKRASLPAARYVEDL